MADSTTLYDLVTRRIHDLTREHVSKLVETLTFDSPSTPDPFYTRLRERRTDSGLQVGDHCPTCRGGAFASLIPHSRGLECFDCGRVYPWRVGERDIDPMTLAGSIQSDAPVSMEDMDESIRARAARGLASTDRPMQAGDRRTGPMTNPTTQPEGPTPIDLDALIPCDGCGAKPRIHKHESSDAPLLDRPESGCLVQRWPSGLWLLECSCGWRGDPGSLEPLPTYRHRCPEMAAEIERLRARLAEAEAKLETP